ncbi:CDP-glycerol glycerophosphotransferase family protein [Methanospirillum sp.]|uniref:CDP-glycerol glycerophosphotransferase family protein n=1 Tax=Methanospirillum sp. TaxID=45200 RepID=UPI0035A10359
MNNPVFVFVCEYCSINKLLITLAKKRNIPTIALQHGIITSTHFGYITRDLSAREYFPDITCLYGESDREVLLNHSVYTPDDLVVTGSPRNDIIYHADRIYSRDKFCMNYNIPLNHQIILWTTQSHGMTDEENTRQLDIVFGSCDSIPGITLVIKQHPGEKKRHYRIIQSYCRNHSCNTLMLPKDSDTFEALYVSDLVITYHSTTGREAAAFKKPLVVLDTQDSVGYSSEGVGVIVSSIQEAKQVISRLLKDDGELAVNREEYIKRYFYAIDGKSTERVVQLIEKVLSENRHPLKF